MKKNRNMVRGIILVATFLALLMCTCVGVIGYNHIKKAYFTSFSEGLQAAAILLEDEFSNEIQGDWSLSEDGELMKGDTAIHDLYQSQLDVRQNRIMGLLTIVTTVFTPLTLITGWYGMNFKYMPELEYRISYPIVILLCIVIVISCLAFFKKKKWL